MSKKYILGQCKSILNLGNFHNSLKKTLGEIIIIKSLKFSASK